MNSYDHYKNLDEASANQFDEQWHKMASDLGFNSKSSNNRLGYGGNDYIAAHRNLGRG
jgi:hypothetical protein